MKDLLMISLNAHQDFALSHIQSKDGQKAYLEMAALINGVLHTSKDPLNVLLALEEAFAPLKGSALSMNYEIKYKKLAIQHASEVIIAISKRFL